MARPHKKGLEYFPLDCKMNSKVEMLEAECGLEGFAVYIKLLQEIYSTDEGELDMSIVFRWKTLGKKYGISEEKLRNIVEVAILVGLFDSEIFQQRTVLTSNGVKKRLGKVSELRQKDRSRKEKADSEVIQELSSGKPTEKYGKGKGKELLNNSSKKGNNSFVANATQSENDPKQSSFVHQIRLVVEEFSPGYYWGGADAKHAQLLEKKLRNLVEVKEGQTPSDEKVLKALRAILANTRDLKEFYHFRDVKTLNQDFNKVVTAIKEQRITAKGSKPEEIKAKAPQIQESGVVR